MIAPSELMRLPRSNLASSKLEAVAKRKPSRNKKMTQSDMETLASAIGNCLGQELQPLHAAHREVENRDRS